MQKPVDDIQRQLEAMADAIGQLTVKPLDTSEVVDTALVEKYKSRFQMLTDDGVPGAISYYLEHLATENTNDMTRATILQVALESY